MQADKWNWVLARGDGNATVAELAAAIGLDKSYVSKVLRLTLLAPKLVDAIVWGAEPEGLSVEQLLKPFPSGVGWINAGATRDVVRRWPRATLQAECSLLTRSKRPAVQGTVPVMEGANGAARVHETLANRHTAPESASDVRAAHAGSIPNCRL